MKKVASITLLYLSSGWIVRPEFRPYKVKKVTDSVEFSPGDYLTKEDVAGLCRRNDWKVYIETRE